MRKAFFALAFIATAMTYAQNPLIRDQFAADPTARVFNDKVYLYPSHDIPAPEGHRPNWFCMADYHVFSSENLTDWTDHGVIITHNDVEWVQQNSFAMWAPDCINKNGKYYFYFPAANKEQRGFGIGVGVADNPEGPFTFETKPIEGMMGIDPCVLVDDDGSSYIYWAGMGMRGAKLKPNMKQLDGNPIVMEGLPEGFKEGPFVFKRNAIYYLTFPWVRKEGGTETLAYATSKSPLGPWDFKGIIMEEWADSCWTNHHSILEYKGQWYIFYHHNDYSPSFDKMRSARADLLFFKKDGTIEQVFPTQRGVGVNKANSLINPDRYSEISKGTMVSYLDTLDYFKGWEATIAAQGGWLRYDNVDFSELKNGAYMFAKVKASENAELIVRENDYKGKIIARLNLVVVGDGNGPFRRDNRGKWITMSVPMEYIPSGITNIFFQCPGPSVSVDWIEFKNRQDYFSKPGNEPNRPDKDGFIRRWMLLDPIEKPIRSNVVFTDTYLDEHFNKQYFEGQQNMLPKDGQKVKVGDQQLQWHALESNTYNVKLFRFADLNKKQTYGVLFWGVTIIDCEEDIENVRLAAGSNGASSWWLNGDKALVLSGDRRMVEDDGMSPRVMLHKGQNVLRFAVINGPGLSDCCVRFIREDGKPVTTFKIY